MVGKLGPAEAKNVRLEVDELLDCQANGINTIDREGIVLDVNSMTPLPAMRSPLIITYSDHPLAQQDVDQINDTSKVGCKCLTGV